MFVFESAADLGDGADPNMEMAGLESADDFGDGAEPKIDFGSVDVPKILPVTGC